jgi:hypothetical protein
MVLTKKNNKVEELEDLLFLSFFGFRRLSFFGFRRLSFFGFGRLSFF